MLMCVVVQGVRTKTVKRSARHVIEKYYSRLNLDFHTNKRVLDEVAVVPSKRMRNKIAGFITHLMKRIQRGPVRGISLKLQEEERERRLDFVPEVRYFDSVWYYFKHLIVVFSLRFPLSRRRRFQLTRTPLTCLPLLVSKTLHVLKSMKLLAVHKLLLSQWLL